MRFSVLSGQCVLCVCFCVIKDVLKHLWSETKKPVASVVFFSCGKKIKKSLKTIFSYKGGEVSG